ncbi:MAG: hypothetical protein KC613_01795, partial [Myxococcales bacterium]|nr:hypothetical protein [Myxococcales bacterium]
MSQASHLEAFDAELSVIGGIFLENQALDRVLPLVDVSDFHAPRHAVVYGRMLELAEQGQPIDTVTVTQALEKAGQLEAAGGPEYVADLAEAAATAVNIEH